MWFFERSGESGRACLPGVLNPPLFNLESCSRNPRKRTCPKLPFLVDLPKASVGARAVGWGSGCEEGSAGAARVPRAAVAAAGPAVGRGGEAGYHQIGHQGVAPREEGGGFGGGGEGRERVD